MPYLKFADVNGNGVLTAKYLLLNFKITPNAGAYALDTAFTYGKQVWRYAADFTSLDEAKSAAEVVVMNNYNLPVAPPSPDLSPRQIALNRYSLAMRAWIRFGNGRVTIPIPVLQDFINDPLYVWPYMNADPITPVRPGGGGGGGGPKPV